MHLNQAAPSQVAGAAERAGRFLTADSQRIASEKSPGGSVTHFLLAGGEQRLFPLLLKASRVLIE